MAGQSGQPRGPNPRLLPNHRERGMGIILKATWQDIADLLGLSVHTAKKLDCGADRRFNPHDLRDVVRFAREYLSQSQYQRPPEPDASAQARSATLQRLLASAEAQAGTLTQAAIAQQLGISEARVSQVAAQLRREGLIKKPTTVTARDGRILDGRELGQRRDIARRTTLRRQAAAATAAKRLPAQPQGTGLREDMQQERALAALEGRPFDGSAAMRRHAPSQERTRLPEWRL